MKVIYHGWETNSHGNCLFYRNRTGKIIKAAPFQSWLPSGSVARVEPNRKWFGKEISWLSKEYNETIDIVMYVSQKDLITYFYYLNTDSHLKAPPSLWLFQNRLFSFDINVNKHYLFSIKRRIRWKLTYITW